MRPLEMLSAAVGYVRKNPDELVKAATNVAALRFGVPIAALRFLASQAKGRKAPKDIEIGASPPALRLAATVDAMGTAVRASAATPDRRDKASRRTPSASPAYDRTT